MSNNITNSQKALIKNNIDELKKNKIIKNINIFKYKSLKNKKKIGKGGNAIVYQCLVNNKLMVIKEQQLYSDTPYILNNSLAIYI